MRGARTAHLGGVGVVHAVVVRLSVMREDIFDLGVDVIAVHFERLFRHADAAEGLQRALEGHVRLEPHDLLESLIEIPRLVACHGGDDGSICIVHAAPFALLFGILHDDLPKLFGRFGGGREEGAVALIRGVVALDEIAHVHFVIAPLAGLEGMPCPFEVMLCKVFCRHMALTSSHSLCIRTNPFFKGERPKF